MQLARAATENPELRKALSNVVLFKANTHEETGDKLADEYGAKGIPHFVLMDRDGKPLDRWRGYTAPSDWLAEFEGALSDLTPIEAKANRYTTEPTETLAAALGRIRTAERKRKEAVEYYRAAQKLASKPVSWYARAIFANQFYGMRDGEFALEDVRASADSVFALSPGDDAHRAWVGSMMADLALEKKDASILTPYLAAALEVSSRGHDEGAKEAHTDLLVAEALLVHKDPERAFTVKKDALPAGWNQDPEHLNDLAWWCFERDVRLSEAEKLARRGVDLAKNDELKAEILDTAAEICNKLGNCEESVRLIVEASRLDPESEHYKKQLARFQEILTKKQQG